MADRIAITSLGIISALGRGKQANIDALTNKRSGLNHPVHLKTKHSNEFLLGEIDLSDDELATALNLPTGDNGYTRTTLIALLAMQELMSSIDMEWLQNDSFAFINANTVGGMCSVENMYLDFISENTRGEFIQYIDTLDCAESTLNICKYYDIKPFTATLSTACSSSANAIMLGARLIKQGVVTRAICGGCDALSRFTLNGFNSLKNVTKGLCKPFDEERMGLNLGEGAGYLLLEKESDAIARGATILGYLSGYSNTNDAHHPTAPPPGGEGALLTMNEALRTANLSSSDIGYVNAHGTATLNNDEAEGKALERLFEDKAPIFSSTKPYTGHTLAAAGAIEAIFSLCTLEQQKAWPNLNFEKQMHDINISPVTEVTDINVEHVLSNSFGFGGSNVSLVFSKA
ncbi:MAG: beta-ketoacyl-[acyl-carrier-protein] synthase family protein [Chitinophagales bacterium]|nr:beta-ketoacyl-[acyl-carrier-protein] synthase family protein [Chitinophagaceae bacterium]MCB9065036.1 beta-ketoacyl-[acyl-carrier-protein] synthase family protein [Chitinophagales bacterium]